MSAVSLRSCFFAAAAFAVLSGCAPVAVDGEAKEEEAKTEAVPEPDKETAAAPVTDKATGWAADPARGLGGAGLLGPVPGREEPRPDASAVKGPIFNGAYAVELGTADRRRAREAIHTALEWLPVGRLKVWRNPDNGSWGTVTATRTYQNANGLWCRAYRQTITIGGDENQDNGAACRNADGGWSMGG